MAGHNKWSKIKHRKAAVEKKRSKAWTKIAKALIVAARHGGGDPNNNLSLRYAIDEARYANMPRDTIERAIKKGAGGEDNSNYESIRYEGYGKGGVAVIVEALTDNRARTVGDVRLAFSDYDGNVGNAGCVGYMFQQRGQILLSGHNLSEEAVMEAAIEAGADDVQNTSDPTEKDEPSTFTILTDPAAFITVKAALELAKFPIEEASLAFIPDNYADVSGEQAQSIIDLIDALEELDDVQKVYTNARFSE